MSLPVSSVLDILRDESHRIGNCQIIPYDRKRVDAFGTNYLHYLYTQCLLSNPRSPWGTLPRTFCGMTDLSADAICGYLSTKPIALLTVQHTPPTPFDVAGFCWPTEVIRSQFASPSNPVNSALCAFCIFRPWWATPESHVLGMLGVAYLFTTYNLRTIIGQRLSTNSLAARWMSRYGARDIGVVPDLLRTHTGGLADCTLSVVKRADFESYVESELRQIAAREDGVAIREKEPET